MKSFHWRGFDTLYFDKTGLLPFHWVWYFDYKFQARDLNNYQVKPDAFQAATPGLT